MKSSIIIFLLIFILASCENNFDVIVEQSNGIVYKYKCKKNKDTLNSDKYSFYNSVLLSKSQLLNGELDGTVYDYYPDGKVKITSNFTKGIANGVNKVYNEDGVLLRRSLYIDNKQVLFEETKVNYEIGLRRKKLIKRPFNDGLWAGEIYERMSDTSKSLIYKGVYVDVLSEDTITFGQSITVKLRFTLPAVTKNPQILVGQFNKNLTCIDTIIYAIPDSAGKVFSFSYFPKKIGNNYLLGSFSAPEYLNTDIFFFKGIYIKKGNDK